MPDMTAYKNVFLGFPIWGETTPPVIRSFLRTHDLSGRTLRPFITHGGYGGRQSRCPCRPRARHKSRASILDRGGSGTADAQSGLWLADRDRASIGKSASRQRRTGRRDLASENVTSCAAVTTLAVGWALSKNGLGSGVWIIILSCLLWLQSDDQAALRSVHFRPRTFPA